MRYALAVSPIYTNDQLTRSKDWNDVIVAYRNGGPLRVRDIGQAVTGPQDTTQAAWADGKRSGASHPRKPESVDVHEIIFSPQSTFACRAGHLKVLVEDFEFIRCQRDGIASKRGWRAGCS